MADDEMLLLHFRNTLYIKNDIFYYLIYKLIYLFYYYYSESSDSILVSMGGTVLTSFR
jgi:hypothetical protein